MPLDEIDRQILTTMRDDARASFTEVGAIVGLSAPAVKRRVDKLQASGVIRSFAALIDPAALGWTTEAYVELYCQGKASVVAIAEAVSRHPEVVEACTVSGDADALIHVIAADIRHFEDVLERIGSEALVVRTKSVLVLSRLLHRD